MMPLIEILKSNETQVLKLGIQQIVSLCGNGRLTDSSECALEFRAFLKQAPSEKLFEYAEICISESFEKSGNVLQDIVNELGRRLDYDVENGRYQGVTGLIGFDGIWRKTKDQALVVEVKTTDAYRINLDTVASYRDRLAADIKIPPYASILIVVGRQDTGDLEAQVRGSRHAWDIRLISVDALIKLVRLKEEAEENTVSKIHDVLVPIEYTRVDKIIDIAFTAAKEVGEAIEKESGPVEPLAAENASNNDHTYSQAKTPRSEIDALKRRILSALGKREGVTLIKKSPALFWSIDETHDLRIACTTSKKYERTNGYWYAYHPSWDRFLSEGKRGFLILGCMDKSIAFALPLEWIRKKLPDLSQTIREDSFYWHLFISDESSNSFFKVSKTNTLHDLSAFAIDLPPE